MNKLLITGCLLATAFAAVAMPTKKELAAAQKLVEDVIAPDVKALNAGRKTVKDVADIQMKLAAGAQSEAEKYLLLQSAFKLYSRGEEFDSAAKVLTAITRDIKDVPPELITELVDKEFNRDMGLKAPREVEMAERAALRQLLIAMQKELEKTRSIRPLSGGLRRPGLLRNSRLQRQQEAQAAMQLQATVDGYTWSYRVNNGEAEIVSENSGKFSCAVSPAPIGSITIPSTLNGVKVASIGCEAFKECGEMLSVTIPDSVTSIKGSAFRRCGRLALLFLPPSLRCIGGYTFQNCTNLTSMVIPPHVGDIGGRAFQGCSAMSEVRIPESVTNIARIAFLGCSSLTSVTIPPSVRSVGDWAFKGCSGLTSVKISQGLATLGPHVFHGCSKLESVTMPSNVVDIAWCAFYECGGLENVMISPCVTNIGGWAFGRCGGLKSVTIPEYVTNIGGNAFRECTNLTSVTMCGECPAAPNNVFGGCRKLKSIHVPANAKSWAGMTEWQGIPLVFDGEVKGVPEMTPVEREFKIGAAPGTVVEVDIGECPLQFVSCPAGKFRMGYSEKPEVAACREIEISSPFWMTKGRLTMEQLRALGVQEGVTENKEGFACVNEASLMVEKLPQLVNKRFEGRVPEGYVFRLPTEAEFEYVQKAGAVGNDPRLAWGYRDDNDSVPNPWGVQKLFHAGGKDCFLDRVRCGKDVVSRFARNTHWTDLVSINYENQPPRDPVGWCEGNRWALLRRGRKTKLTGSCLYGSTFYFVLAPDESRLNKFIWK